MLLEIKYLVS